MAVKYIGMSLCKQNNDYAARMTFDRLHLRGDVLAVVTRVGNNVELPGEQNPNTLG